MGKANRTARGKEQRERKAEVGRHFSSSADTKLGETKTDSGSHASSSQGEQKSRKARYQKAVERVSGEGGRIKVN